MKSQKSYSQKLKDPRWQRTRLEVLDRAYFECEQCGAGDKTLHVHHGYYERGLDPWEYPANSLSALCEDCHAEIGLWRSRIDRELALMPASELMIISGFCRSQTPDGLVDVNSAEEAMGISAALVRSDEKWVIDRIKNGKVDLHSLWCEANRPSEVRSMRLLYAGDGR